MLAVICSGQGDQGPALFDRVRADPAAAAVLAQATAERWLDDAAAAWLAAPPDPAALHADRLAQPLLCLYQWAAWTALRGRLGRVAVFAGLSLGELSAAACAGCLDGRSLLALAARRAALMDAAAPPGDLVSVSGLDADAIADLCRTADAAVAIRFGPQHWTLGCLHTGRDALLAAAQARGAARVVPLGVRVASHTPWLASAAEPFATDLAAAPLRSPSAPVLAGVSGQRQWRPADIAAHLAAQLHTTVRWDLCAEALLASGCRVFVELGPGTALSHLLLERDPTLAARSLDEFATLSAAAAWAAAALAREQG